MREFDELSFVFRRSLPSYPVSPDEFWRAVEWVARYFDTIPPRDTVGDDEFSFFGGTVYEAVDILRHRFSGSIHVIDQAMEWLLGEKAMVVEERYIGRNERGDPCLDDVFVPIQPKLRHLGAEAANRAEANPSGQTPKKCVNQVTTKPSEAEDETPDELTDQPKLSRAHSLAYRSFQLAEKMAGKELTDREAYEHLYEHGLPEELGDFSDLTEYQLPDNMNTWFRYVREARHVLRTNKYSSRNGREGHSVVPIDQL